ncbi:MAG: SpoIIE family protein phosphatase, partial [Candidatus Latescibacteria bacterium]|nr:SpoIIE family protein phosphatase [Candidatus Latescibacterota bacterium]
MPDLLPQAYPLHIGALSLPAEKVGGDFYDFIPNGPGTFDFMLGDITGHGLSAALAVALAQATFRETIEAGVEVPALLDHANHLLHHRLRRRTFVAANYGHVVPENCQVDLFNAGQQAFLFDARTGVCREIAVEGSTYPLGIVGRGGYLPCRITLGQGDLLVCCSDGFPEALSTQKEMFGYERLKAAVQQVAEAEPVQIIDHLFNEILAFATGAEQSDDLTLVVVKADASYRPRVSIEPDKILAGERRPVALFCLQCLEGETPAPLSDSMREQLLAEIDQHGGVADHLSPDTLVACFGLPDLHEDDPERAILAARETERVLRNNGLGSRCGLHIGHIVARADGTVDYSLMGETLVVALWLLDEARPGTSRLSAEAFHRLEGRVRLQATEEHHLARSAYVLPSLAKIQPVRRYGKDTAASYVGRRLELKHLHRAWRRAARRGGVPTLVTIAGEAGIGKSRLVEEFLRRQKPGVVLRGQARAYPPEAGGLFASMLRHWLEIEEGERGAAIQKLGERLARLNDPRLQSASPFLKALLGSRQDLPPQTDPRSYQAGLAQAVRLLMEMLAEQRPKGDPLVLVLEDLHWMDSIAEGILTTLVPQVQAEAGLLILAVSRPHEEMRHAFAGYRRHAHLDLAPLAQEEVQQWIDQALRGARVSAEISSILLRLGEGHPLFLEELLIHLREQGLLYRERGVWQLTKAAAWNTPETLNGLILSRVGQLADPVRQVLKEASVIGQEVPVNLLRTVADEASAEEQLQTPLQILVHSQFLVQGEREGTYLFKHALIRQAVYESILSDDRAWLHARIAQRLEILYPDQAEEFARRLTEHYYRAHQPEPALKYLLIALKQCVEQFSYQEGLSLAERGRELTAQLNDPSSTFAVLRQLELLLGLKADRDGQKRVLDQMDEIAQALNDVDLGGATWLRKCRLSYELNDSGEEILLRAEKALSYTQQARDRIDEADALSMIGAAYCRLRNYSEALIHFQKALHLYQRVGDKPKEIRCLANHAMGYAGTGQHEKSYKARHEAISFLRDTGDRQTLVIQLGNQGSVLVFFGQFDQALTLLGEGYQIGGEIGFQWGQAFNLMATIETKLGMEDFEGALQRTEEYRRMAEITQSRSA